MCVCSGAEGTQTRSQSQIGVSPSFLTGGYPHPSQWEVTPSFLMGVYPILPDRGHPIKSQWGCWYPTPTRHQPGLDGGYPLERLCLDRLCRGHYTSSRFPQEDFLASAHIQNMREGNVLIQVCVSVHTCGEGTPCSQQGEGVPHPRFRRGGTRSS